MLEGPTVRGQVVGVRREPGAGERIDRGASQRRRADHEQHLLGSEEHDPQVPSEARGAPSDAVDPDALAAAAAVGPGALDGDLEDVAPDVTLDPGQVSSPADELTVGGRPVAASPAEQGDPLEQARLAGGIGTPDQLGAGTEGGIECRVAAEVEDRKRVEPGDARRSSGPA